MSKMSDVETVQLTIRGQIDICTPPDVKRDARSVSAGSLLGADRSQFGIAYEPTAVVRIV
jgi:hypothetical protein